VTDPSTTGSRPDRHFTVAVFVVRDGRVILMKHPRLGMLLPPGGHIGAGETPDEAALREVREETGLEVELAGETGPGSTVERLVRPAGIQLEPIAPGHYHIDLIYFARVKGDGRSLLAEKGTLSLGWYSPEEAARAGANAEVLSWATKAMKELAPEECASREAASAESSRV